MLGIGTAGPIGLESAPVIGPTDPTPTPTRDQIAERDAWAILASVHGLGPVGLATLLERFGSARDVLEDASRPGGVSRLAAVAPSRATHGGGQVGRVLGEVVAAAIGDAVLDADTILGRIRSAGLSIVTLEDEAYPSRLAAIELPPHVLFVRGALNALEARHAVAVVGTRRATIEGRAFASRLADALVRAGATVVSGLAYGIDGAAHEATVHAGGTTIAVIGGGHGTLYPRAHATLARRIVDGGGAVVSEHPPDGQPTTGTFPRRNRVIAGLSDATIVVEAPAKSGALITASWALEQGRECFLVPGSPWSQASRGALSFLRDYPGSARIVASVATVLDDLGLIDHSLAPPAAPRQAEAALVEIGGTAARIGR